MTLILGFFLSNLKIEDFIWNIRSLLNDPKNSLRKEVHGIVEKCVAEIRALDSRGDDELFSEPLDPKYFEFNQTVHCRLCKVLFIINYEY